MQSEPVDGAVHTTKIGMPRSCDVGSDRRSFEGLSVTPGPNGCGPCSGDVVGIYGRVGGG